MIDVEARDRVDTLLGAVKDRPAELPLAEVVGLACEPVTVSIDRRSEEVVVVITPRPGALFDPLSGRFRVRYAASRAVVAARERFPSRSLSSNDSYTLSYGDM